MRAGLLHAALLHANAAEFLAGTLPYIRRGLELREPVLVVERADKIALLRRELGEDAQLVRFARMEAIGANPARLIAAWRDFLEEHAGGGTEVRGIGEPIWSSRPEDELAECQVHESLMNVAFSGGRPWRLLCPYDSASLPKSVIDEARRSHAFVIERQVELPSAAFRGRAVPAALFDGRLTAPPGDARGVSFATGGLREVRALVARECAAAGLDPESTVDLVAAVTEVATNSLRHGGGGGHALTWHDAVSVLCEVRDRGRFASPLAGRERPRNLGSPAGLWLANQLCDLVQVRSYATGTVVRLTVRRERARPVAGWAWAAV